MMGTDAENKKVLKKVSDMYNIRAVLQEKTDDKWVISDGSKTYILWKFIGIKEKLHNILEWQIYLCKKNCEHTLPIIRDKDGKAYIEDNNEFFYLTNSYEGQEFIGDDPLSLLRVVDALGNVHVTSKKDKKNKDEKLFKHPKSIQDRLTALIVYYKFLRENGARTDFERIYFESFDVLYNQGQEAVQHMVLASYGQEWEKEEGLCINNLLKNNIILSKERVVFLDLTKISYGPMVMDFSVLINSYMPGFNWDSKIIKDVIKKYEENNPLNEFEKHFLLAKLRFPSRYWLYAYQYFSNNGDGVDLTNKLKSYIRECKKRDLCLDYLENWLWG